MSRSRGNGGTGERGNGGTGERGNGGTSERGNGATGLVICANGQFHGGVLLAS